METSEYLAFKNCKKELINYYNNLFGKITTHLANKAYLKIRSSKEYTQLQSDD